MLAASIAAASAPAQTLSVVSGDGQAAAQNFQFPSPLIVMARNASGQPASGVTVNWSLNGPGTLVMGPQTVTDSTGRAENRFVGATIFGDQAFTQTIVTASAGSSSVTMRETTSGADLVSGQIFVQAQIVSPNLGDVISGASGTVGPTPIRVNVYGIHNAGVQQVPNVAVRLIPDNPSGPTVACAAGTGITDANGIANCQVLFGGSTGTSTFSVEVGGGFRTFSPFRFSVTQGGGTGQPAAFRITITGGNNQSGAAGTQLPARLTARVEDASGNPLANVPVNWQASSLVTLSSFVSTSDASGAVSTAVILGSVPGQAQVQVSTANFAAQATFNVTVAQGTTTTPGQQGVPATLRILSGNNQAGAPGSQLPSPLTARVEDASGNPLAGIPVTWQPSQSVSVSNASATSNASGLVSATVILGSALGSAQVQLRTLSTSQTPFGPSANIIQAVFTLTVSATGTPSGPLTAPALLRILGGDNQSGAPGAILPTPLMARVEDASGIPLPNTPVVWQPSASVSLSNASSASDASGIVSATVILGSAGPAQVQLRTISTSQTPFGPSANIVQTVFNLTASGTPTTPTPPSSPALLRILGGNNQSGSPGGLLSAPLVARVEDSAGNPIPNAPVVWQPSSTISLSNMSSISDGNGVVSASVILGSVTGPAQAQVRMANAPAIQAVFSLTITGSTVTPTQPASSASSLRILGGNSQSGAPGSRLQAPLTAVIEDSSGRPVPNVPVFWETSQGLTLSGATSTSDAHGIVSTLVTLGPSTGPAQVTLRTTGGFQTPFGVTPGATLQVVFSLLAVGQPQPGAPAALRVVGGDNQSGLPGARLPFTLAARVEDAAGNPVPNVPVIWQPSPGAALSLTNLVSISDASGIVSATAQLGATPGPTQAQVRIANTPALAFFNLVVIPPQPSVLRILAGNNLSAEPGKLISLTARVEDGAGNPVPNVSVIWQALDPQIVQLGNVVSVSDVNGVVSATATLLAPGTTQVQVRITAIPVLAQFNLQGTQAPVPNTLTFLNAASGEPGSVSPTGLVRVFGDGIATGVQGCLTGSQGFGPLPLSVNGVRVQFAAEGYSALAPIFSLCNLGPGKEYIVIQAPADLPLQETTVTVQAQEVAVAQSHVTAAAAGPGIFETEMSDGSKRAVLQRVDGSYVSLENPAQKGERLRAFVTGLGRAVTASGTQVNTNQPGTPDDDAAPPNPVALVIGNRTVEPVSSVYSAESLGVYVVTFDLPEDAPSGSDVDLSVVTASGEQSIAGKVSKAPIQ